VGSEISLLALPLVAMLALHASNFAVGTLTALTVLIAYPASSGGRSGQLRSEDRGTRNS
jgi:hypothetical protein